MGAEAEAGETGGGGGGGPGEAILGHRTGKSRRDSRGGCGFAIFGCAALRRKERWGLTHGAPAAARVSRGRGANLGLARRRGASSVGWAALA